MSDQTILQLAQIARNLLKWAFCAPKPFSFADFFWSVFKPKARAGCDQADSAVGA